MPGPAVGGQTRACIGASGAAACAGRHTSCIRAGALSPQAPLCGGCAAMGAAGAGLHVWGRTGSGSLPASGAAAACCGASTAAPLDRPDSFAAVCRSAHPGGAVPRVCCMRDSICVSMRPIRVTVSCRSLFGIRVRPPWRPCHVWVRSKHDAAQSPGTLSA